MCVHFESHCLARLTQSKSVRWVASLTRWIWFLNEAFTLELLPSLNYLRTLSSSSSLDWRRMYACLLPWIGGGDILVLFLRSKEEISLSFSLGLRRTYPFPFIVSKERCPHPPPWVRGGDVPAILLFLPQDEDELNHILFWALLGQFRLGFCWAHSELDPTVAQKVESDTLFLGWSLEILSFIFGLFILVIGRFPP